MWKSDPPWKRPKCQINDQNRHFAFSEPPGPGVFRFQGVPRDPVLRPKSDPPYADGEFLHHFMHFHFLCISHFIILWHFHHFINCAFCVNHRFCHYIVIRPYGALFHKGEYDDMCGGSPLISCRGDLQERSMLFDTLVLPSLNRFFCFIFGFM